AGRVSARVEGLHVERGGATKHLLLGSVAGDVADRLAGQEAEVVDHCGKAARELPVAGVPSQDEVLSALLLAVYDDVEGSQDARALVEDRDRLAVECSKRGVANRREGGRIEPAPVPGRGIGGQRRVLAVARSIAGAA